MADLMNMEFGMVQFFFYVSLPSILWYGIITLRALSMKQESGVVIKVKKSYLGHEEFDRHYKPVIQYVTPEGDFKKFSPVVAVRKRPQLGLPVKIMYNPRHPEKVCVRRFREVYLAPFTLHLFLLFFSTVYF